MIQNFLVT